MKGNMRFVRAMSVDEAYGKCAWCRKRIHEEASCDSLSVKSVPGIDFSTLPSGPVLINLGAPGRTVIALRPAADSEARRDGCELLFTVCPQECAFELRLALAKEISS
jgi:hypothetical protein